MTRRSFLGACGSAMLVAGCEIEDVERLVDDVRTEARFGVLSNVEIGSGGSATSLKKALRYFRQEGVDAVVIADGAALGERRDRLEALQTLWREVFFDRPDVRLILEPGRHEVGGFAFGVSARRPVDRCDALTFHGHGRKALTSDFWFFDDETRTVYAGSMNGLVVQAGYEYGGRVSDGKMTIRAAQGLLVSVYSSTVSIRRLDFTQTGPADGRRLRRDVVYAEDLADALVLDRATLRSSASEIAPEFWEDTRLRSICGYADAKRILTVSWPHVLKRYRGARAARYEVGVHVQSADGAVSRAAIVRRYVLTSGFHLAEERDCEPVGCVLDLKGVEDLLRVNPRLVLTVTPVGTRGARGKSLVLPLGH